MWNYQLFWSSSTSSIESLTEAYRVNKGLFIKLLKKLLYTRLKVIPKSVFFQRWCRNCKTDENRRATKMSKLLWKTPQKVFWDPVLIIVSAMLKLSIPLHHQVKKYTRRVNETFNANAPGNDIQCSEYLIFSNPWISSRTKTWSCARRIL